MLVEGSATTCMSRGTAAVFHVIGSASRERRVQRFFYQHFVPTERCSRYCEQSEAIEARRSQSSVLITHKSVPHEVYK
ncbi:MAG: hypothetical protein LBC68_05660 [Prevotellaceae bacterium]|jgi:hypothetical protein|nr:hypothetical protein [Prevotellaceae bacterium]